MVGRRDIPSAPPDEDELREATDVLLRRLASFYTRYAPEILTKRRAIEAGEITMSPYRELVSKKKLENASEIVGSGDDVGDRFDML